MQHLRAADRKATPWKNGGGVTEEIAAWPPGSGLGDFDWRVSTALVASDGPFSRFDGIDRTLLVLTGAGLILQVGGGAAVTVDARSQPLSFPGDVPVDAKLVSGPVSDLNVMTRRGRWSSRTRRDDLRSESEFAARGAICLVLALAPFRLSRQAGAIAVGAGDALILAAGETLSIDPSVPSAQVVVVELSPIGG